MSYLDQIPSGRASPRCLRKANIPQSTPGFIQAQIKHSHTKAHRPKSCHSPPRPCCSSVLPKSRCHVTSLLSDGLPSLGGLDGAGHPDRQTGPHPRRSSSYPRPPGDRSPPLASNICIATITSPVPWDVQRHWSPMIKALAEMGKRHTDESADLSRYNYLARTAATSSGSDYDSC